MYGRYLKDFTIIIIIIIIIKGLLLQTV
jgi:hypothetical protein